MLHLNGVVDITSFEKGLRPMESPTADKTNATVRTWLESQQHLLGLPVPLELFKLIDYFIERYGLDARKLSPALQTWCSFSRKTKVFYVRIRSDETCSADLKRMFPYANHQDLGYYHYLCFTFGPVNKR